MAWSVPRDKRFGDFVLDVDATQVDGPNDNSYGVIFRYVDDRNFYRLDISGDGYFAVFKYKDGKWTKVQDYTETAGRQAGRGDQSPASDREGQSIHVQRQRSVGQDLQRRRFSERQHRRDGRDAV